jgi:predicted nucleic acid-binding protein
MRAALDTNVLAYAEGVGDEICCTAAVTLIE